MVRTLSFHCQGFRVNPWSRNLVPTSCVVQPKNLKTKKKEKEKKGGNSVEHLIELIWGGIEVINNTRRKGEVLTSGKTNSCPENYKIQPEFALNNIYRFFFNFYFFHLFLLVGG